MEFLLGFAFLYWLFSSQPTFDGCISAFFSMIGFIAVGVLLLWVIGVVVS